MREFYKISEDFRWDEKGIFQSTDVVYKNIKELHVLSSHSCQLGLKPIGGSTKTPFHYRG